MMYNSQSHAVLMNLMTRILCQRSKIQKYPKMSPFTGNIETSYKNSGKKWNIQMLKC